MDAAFYTVCDARHFIGAVALLNSLRIVGHREPFVVVDSGLEPWQRELLTPKATLVPATPGMPPMMLKTAGPLAAPAGVMGVLDSDVIVTRSLDPVLEHAARGAITVFAADADRGRYFADWGTLLGLGGVPRVQTYAASGHLFVSGEPGLEFLREYERAQARVDVSQTLIANTGLVPASTREDPFHYPDMDVLNALLMTTVPAENVEILPYELTPYAPFPGVELLDSRTLRCRSESGEAPYLLHHILRKPWLAPTRPNVYSRLLPRLLLEPDVELRLEPGRIPLRLRQGPLGGADRSRVATQSFLHDHLRGRLGIRPKIARWRAAAAAARSAST